MRYPSVRQMEESHIIGMQKVHKFLAKHGANHWHKEYRYNHSLQIRVEHANNYIEMGSLDEDPLDILYYIWTQEEYSFRVPVEHIGRMWKALHSMQGLSKKRIAPNVRIETDVNNQYCMHKRVSFSDYCCEYVEFRIEFRIYHHQPNWEAYKS